MNTTRSQPKMMWETQQRQAETIQPMCDEIAVLKGEKAKPKFKSSKMNEKAGEKEGEKESEDGDGIKKKRAGSDKRSKTVGLPTLAGTISNINGLSLSLTRLSRRD